MRFFYRCVLAGLLCTGAVSAAGQGSSSLTSAESVPRLLTDLEQRCWATDARSTAPRIEVLLTPRMVYSLLEWPRMRAAARAAGFEARAWKDPRVPETEWSEALGATGLDGDAVQAVLPDCRSIWTPVNHWPYAWTTLGGRLHPWPVLGVMPDAAWIESLELRRRVLLDSVAPSACIAPVSYLALDPDVTGRDSLGGAVLGAYERISPDGRFVLRSNSGARIGQVSLVELPATTGGALSVFRTPLSNEAFPVQGSWRYLVDVDGRHFRLADVLRQQTGAQPLFQGGMNGFYAAAAEMPTPGTDTSGLVWIRSMSWPQGDRAGSGTGPLQLRTLGVREGDDGRVAVVRDSGAQFICGARQTTDGNVYTLPMLSVDGLEFSAMPINPGRGRPSMRVYGLAPDALGANHPCDLRMDLHAMPGKAVFGFASEAPAMLVYTDNASVHFVDRRAALSDQVFRIEDHHSQVLASAFPGFTRDGRIVFAATWKECPVQGRCVERAGYVIADPYQNPDYREQQRRLGLAPAKACITLDDVLAERRRFAARLGLAP